MNQTPRGFNRFMLALLAVILMGIGAGLILISTVPAAAQWWQVNAGEQLSSWRKLAADTRTTSGSGSWIWLVVAVVLLLVVVLMVTWVGKQGHGRAGLLYEEGVDGEDSGVQGKVLLGTAVAERTLRNALLERTDLVSVAVTSYDFKGQTALRVRVLPRLGVPPHHLAAEIVELAQALEVLLGVKTPVLLSIGSGARARFTKAERVR